MLVGRSGGDKGRDFWYLVLRRVDIEVWGVLGCFGEGAIEAG